MKNLVPCEHAENDFCCKVCSSGSTPETYLVKEMMFGSGDEYRYDKCPDCKVLQLSTLVTDPDKLYPSNYYSFNDSQANRIIKKIKKYLYSKVVAAELGDSNGIGKFFGGLRISPEAKSLKGIISKNDKILDVGCGIGELIEALFKLGYKNVSGIDPFIA
jgi:SAM-dependent methyltransferase